MIEKLEFEMKKARDDSEKSTEARIGRLKAKHETEIGDKYYLDQDRTHVIIFISSDELAKEIEDQKSKGAEVKEKLVQKEGEAAMLASINKQVSLLNRVANNCLRIVLSPTLFIIFSQFHIIWAPKM